MLLKQKLVRQRFAPKLLGALVALVSILLFIYVIRQQHSVERLHQLFGAHRHGGTDNDMDVREAIQPVAIGVESKDGQKALFGDDFPSDYQEDDEGKLEYREIYSLTTRDRKFFPLHFDGKAAYNPNILPHPIKHDWYVVVAQNGKDLSYSEEFTCEASLYNDVMICAGDAVVLPVAPSVEGVCPGDLEWYNFRRGPRDARAFYGPDVPYLIYGSQSQHTCLGIWLHDVRSMLDAFQITQAIGSQLFTSATEIQRPAPWQSVEKNWFLFWDSDGKAYAHYDLWPRRVFAGLDFDGSVTEDLAPAAHYEDQVCMAKYMPYLGPELESIHQATNSLAVTLCGRLDPACRPNDNNTFVMHIFQHKTYFDYHAVYEPYVMLFRQAAPFELYAISQNPFWIKGRGNLSVETFAKEYEGRPEAIPQGHTEMFYITSMSWKESGLKYHGYMDDPMFLAFGIEDTRSGAIDVLSGDLLQDLAFC